MLVYPSDERMFKDDVIKYLKRNLFLCLSDEEEEEEE